MTNQGKNISSQSDDVPIPSTHYCGRTTRIEWLKQAINHSQISFSGKHIANKVTPVMLFITLLVPSFLSTPEPVEAISTGPNTEEYSENIYASQVPSHWDPTLTSILINEIERHNIDSSDWSTRVDAFIEMVKHIESDNKRNAYNPSGAMSYFQFKGESAKIAHLRLINYMRRHDLGEIPDWSVSIYYRPNRLYNTSADRQALLMIINIIELDREVGTSYFKHFLDGDNNAAKKAYYKYHHTAPDKSTIKRTERLFTQYFN